MFLVSVPATSANVGAGFDCLGLALSLRGNFTFRSLPNDVIIKGCEPAYCTKDNLVYLAKDNEFHWKINFWCGDYY